MSLHLAFLMTAQPWVKPILSLSQVLICNSCKSQEELISKVCRRNMWRVIRWYILYAACFTLTDAALPGKCKVFVPSDRQ